MKTWPLFIILRQLVTISVTVFSNWTKLTNYLFIFYDQKINRSLAKQMMRLDRKNFVNQLICISTMEGTLLNKTDLHALYLRKTYCHRTSTRPPSCKHLDNWLYIDSSCSVDHINLVSQRIGKCKVTVFSDVYFDVTTVWTDNGGHIK